MNHFVLDTHVLVWWIEGNSKLPPTIAAQLDDPAHKKVIPAIALAELIDLCLKRRVRLVVQSIVPSLINDPDLRIAPISATIAARTARLSQLDDIHDRLIVATALEMISDARSNVLLVTADARIRAAQVVPVLWT